MNKARYSIGDIFYPKGIKVTSHYFIVRIEDKKPNGFKYILKCFDSENTFEADDSNIDLFWRKHFK